MIGLIVLAFAAVWIAISAKGAATASYAFRSSRWSWLIGLTTFVFLAVLPFLDEIVGRWQFHRLCESEALVWVHPEANKVEVALRRPALKERDGLAFPVREQVSEYVDAATGNPFFRVTAFHTGGGFVMRSGLNMGNSTSCWPDRWVETSQALKIDLLVGRSKNRNQ